MEAAAARRVPGPGPGQVGSRGPVIAPDHSHATTAGSGGSVIPMQSIPVESQWS